MIQDRDRRRIIAMTYAQRTTLRERPGRALTLPDSVAPLFSDIPEGMTILEYRRERAAGAPRGWRGILSRTSR
jgi:hypothetical protein